MRGGTFIAFVLGAAVGVIASKQYFKKKYEEISNEEIRSTKEAYGRKYPKNDISDEPNDKLNQLVDDVKSTKRTVKEYATMLQKTGYTNYANRETNKVEESDNKPYVISPEEFGECEEYERVSLVYYSDQIVAYDDASLVEDVEATIGFESLSRFGEYEDDALHVRNDRLKCDFEILYDQRKYSDAVKYRPYKVEV